MKKVNLIKIWPVIGAIVLFIALTMAYFSPLLEGKQIKQSDVTHFQGMSKEISDYREQTGEEALWTNSMFGGMPAFQISVVYHGNLVKYIDKVFLLGLPHPAGLVFLYFIGFFILLLVLRVDPKLSIIGAIGFAFSSFFFIVLIAGHNTQAHAIGYMAPVLAGIILCFRGRYLLGGVLTALFLALEIYTNHIQMTYYLMLMVVILGIVEFIGKYKEKKIKEFFKATVIMLAALFIAIGVNITNLWSTYEYGKYTTRGKSELTADAANKTSGLDRDYATSWSYGKMETFTLLIPNFNGGGSEDLSASSNSYKALIENGYPKAQALKAVKGLPTYFGAQPFTSGPVYAGAIMCFLFILGLFLVKGKYKWWILSAVAMSFFLAWGKNMMWFSNFFFDYVPGYNKFRSVSFALVIAELSIPILAMLALQKLFDATILKEVKIRALKRSSFVAIGLIVVFGLIGSMFYNYVMDSDAQYVSQGYFPDWFMTALQADRKGLLVADSIRSLVFILIAITFLWLFVKEKIKSKILLITLLSLIVVIDMWPVDKRYLNSDNFESKAKATIPYPKTLANETILADKTLDYRVLNLSDPFNDAGTSYYHKSIGGYHGAKLKRYQELIEGPLSGDITKIKTAFSAKSADSAVFVALTKIPVLNMLNAKYIIYNPGAAPIKNPNTLGCAWFVDQVKLVANADSEIAALTTFDPSATAIVDKRFESNITNKTPGKDTTASIILSDYLPNKLSYKYSASKPQLAVFSEIYYDKGWNVYIDGKLMPYFRANYVLRAMEVPAGTHEIVWKFEPKVYVVGEKISLASSIILIIVLAGGLFVELRRRINKQPEVPVD